MIIRQFCARNGRSAFSRSSTSFLRSYTSESFSDHATPLTTCDDALAASPLANAEAPSKMPTPLNRNSGTETGLIEDKLRSLESSTHSIKSHLNAHTAARILSLPDETTLPVQQDAGNAPEAATKPSEPTYTGLKNLYTQRRTADKAARSGTHVSRTYDPLTIVRNPPTPQTLTLSMLLANQTHLGHHTSLWHPGNSRYIFGVRDGIHVISLDETFAHLRRASKVVQEVARRGGIILFIGTRKGQDEIAVNAAKLAQGYHIVDRWVPGSLTNGQQILGGCAIKVVDILDRDIPEFTSKLTAVEHPVLKPDLVICLNPLENEVCLHECGLHNVPTIGVIDTDVNSSWVTYPIPGNDDSLRSIALIAGCLGRAGQEGQKERLESAKMGISTYDSVAVQLMLKNLEEVESMEVSDPAGGVSINK